MSLSVNSIEAYNYSTTLMLRFTLGEAFSHQQDFYLMDSNLFAAALGLIPMGYN